MSEFLRGANFTYTEPKMTTVTRADIHAKFRSRRKLYDYLTIDCELALPEEPYTTYRWLGRISKGKLLVSFGQQHFQPIFTGTKVRGDDDDKGTSHQGAEGQRFEKVRSIKGFGTIHAL